MKLVHYYHIYAINEWRRIVTEHLDALERSGLGNASELRIGVVGSLDDAEEAIAMCTERFPTKVIFKAVEGWEVDTIKQLYDDLDDDPNTYILYTHTKGVLLNNDIWRRTMTKHLIYQWRDCVELLKTHDATGCYWVTKENSPGLAIQSYFAGHFWWVRQDFLSKLSHPGKYYGSRYVIEQWFDEGNPNVAELKEGRAGQWFDAPTFLPNNWNTTE